MFGRSIHDCFFDWFFRQTLGTMRKKLLAAKRRKAHTRH
jgi:hypothetical protein